MPLLLGLRDLQQVQVLSAAVAIYLRDDFLFDFKKLLPLLGDFLNVLAQRRGKSFRKGSEDSVFVERNPLLSLALVL